MKYKYSTRTFKTSEIIELPDNSIVLSSYYTESRNDRLNGLTEINITIRYIEPIN